MRHASPIRRQPLLVLLVIAATLLTSGVLPHSAAAPSRHHHHGANRCHKSRIDVPSCGVLWGLFKPRQPVPGKSHWSAHYGKVERRIGRRFDVVKDYEDWSHGTTFPSGPEAHFARKGHGRRILYYSWNATHYGNGGKVSYRSIAHGAWDRSVIRPEARRLKHYHHKVFLDFNHEFDSHAQAGHGSPAQYVAAYRHIHHVFHRVGVHNVIWSWVSTGWIGNAKTIRRSYPGRRFVDWIGYDPYNFAYCAGSPWRSPLKSFNVFYRWVGRQHNMRGKPLLLSEYASAPSSRVKHWYASVAGALRKLPRIKAAIQFSGPSPSGCDFSLVDLPAAMAGFAHSATARYITGAARR
jgi:hypothetical protein